MGLDGHQAWRWIWQLIPAFLLLTASPVTAATPFLVGNFFGVPGTDATFDYVVSDSTPATHWKREAYL